MFARSIAVRDSVAALIILVAFCGKFPAVNFAQAIDQNQATITIAPASPVKTFDPNRDLGAGIDGHAFGEVDKLLSLANIKEMLSVGIKPITYRLRTELAIDAWHWNPQGTWSDESNKQGYWTSDSRSEGDISLSYGYYLPRRGDTLDQANNNGYSRIDDGDAETFWKSNPYLDKYFTKEDNTLHPQWVVVDLGTEKSVDAIRISWGSPFAVDYKIQYANITDISDISHDPPGLWHTFATGVEKARTGGVITTRLSRAAIKTQYVRILLGQSSYTAATDSKDVRDTLGFAVREISLGTMDSRGTFHDEILRGSAKDKQTNIIVSSNDPWHRSSDIDHKTEHVGFDRIFKSGLTGDSPVLVPVCLLFGTPENAAAEITYLNERGYKIAGVELGEEPDGQYISPEDYGTLYIQWADAIHRADPNIKLGGPSFQEIEPDWRDGKKELGNPVWLERFIHYLDKHDRASDFSFFSFEWYPFDEVCKPTPPQIAQTANKLASSINAFRRHGLKPDVPLVISEYGYSAFATRAEIDIEGAIFNADTVGAFLSLGGSQAYLYGYEVNNIEHSYPCTAGNNALLLADEKGNIKYRTATYFGTRLMMQEWLQPTGGDHKFYPGVVSTKKGGRKSPIAAYAVLRPDGQWSVMIVNRDSINAWRVDLRSKNENGQAGNFFEGEVDAYQFSSKEFKWDERLNRPAKSGPPTHTRINADVANNFQLPAYSVTVLRGRAK